MSPQELLAATFDHRSMADTYAVWGKRVLPASFDHSVYQNPPEDKRKVYNLVLNHNLAQWMRPIKTSPMREAGRVTVRADLTRLMAR